MAWGCKYPNLSLPCNGVVRSDHPYVICFMRTTNKNHNPEKHSTRKATSQATKQPLPQSAIMILRCVRMFFTQGNQLEKVRSIIDDRDEYLELWQLLEKADQTGDHDVNYPRDMISTRVFESHQLILFILELHEYYRKLVEVDDHQIFEFYR